jgi:hypothetical protein
LHHFRIAAPRAPLARHLHRARARTGFVVGLALTVSTMAGLAAPTATAASTTRLATATVTSSTTLTTTTIDKPWYTTERFYLGLLNCTRTGGWVLSDGTCRGYGSGHYSAYVAPISYSYGISDRVSRPYAKLLAVKGLCSHTANGDPGYRLRRAGYLLWTWGENIGCGDGYSSAKASVLASHLRFQAERSTNGGHWRNMKNPKFHAVGIGIWRYSTRTRLVIDFYA